MKVKFNRHTLELYDSIQDLPITRFQTFNINLMIDAGIGANLDEFEGRVATISKMINGGRKEDANRELSNMIQTVRFIMGNVSPEYRAFVALIKSIDGRIIHDEDLQGEGIDAIIKELGQKRFSIGHLKQCLKDLKKKFDSEFEVFFTTFTDSATVKEYYATLKKRTILVLQAIQEPIEGVEKRISDIDDFLLSKVKIKNYFGANGLEVLSIKRFEEMCVLLNQHKVSDDSKKLTTLAFYQALETVKQQIKKR